MPRTAHTQPQTTIYETTLDNPELEQLLEKRQAAKKRRANAAKEFGEANEQVKARLGELDLGVDAPVRVGRFVVTFRAISARSVSFETEPTQRLSISLLEESV